MQPPELHPAAAVHVVVLPAAGYTYPSCPRPRHVLWDSSLETLLDHIAGLDLMVLQELCHHPCSVGMNIIIHKNDIELITMRNRSFRTVVYIMQQLNHLWTDNNVSEVYQDSCTVCTNWTNCEIDDNVFEVIQGSCTGVFSSVKYLIQKSTHKIKSDP